MTTVSDKSNERLSGRVTVETARLVAEVSQISSEDWARKYQFDDVCWPPRRRNTSLQSSTTSSTKSNRFNNDENSYHALSSLASASVEGVLNLCRREDGTTKVDHDVPCSTIIFVVGGSASGKTQTVFGSSLASLVSSSTRAEMVHENDIVGHGHDLGLLGEIVMGILSSQLAAGEERSTLKCSLSILEIVNADVLRDLFAASEEGLGENGGSNSLRVRYLDARGAAVLNLRQRSIETMEQLSDVLHTSFKSNIRGERGGTMEGTVILLLPYWYPSRADTARRFSLQIWQAPIVMPQVPPHWVMFESRSLLFVAYCVDL